MAGKRNKNNLVGVTGEYYVCAELGKMGILALTAPKNNPLFDVVAITLDAKRTITIQVKTMSLHNKQGWNLGMDITQKKNNPTLFTILVNLKAEEVSFYIYEYDVLADKIANNYQKYLSKKKRDGGERKDTKLRWFDFKDFQSDDHARKNKWDILGFPMI